MEEACLGRVSSATASAEAAGPDPDHAGLARRLPGLLGRRMPSGREHGRRVPSRPAAILRVAQRSEHPGPVDPRPGRLHGLAPRAGPGPGHARPAHRLAEGLLSLPAAGRRAPRQPGGTAGEPEALGAGAEGPQPRADRPAAGKPAPHGPVLAPRSGPAGAALRDRMPGLGDFQLEALRHAPRRWLLHVPRQGRQGAARALGRTGGGSRAGVPGTRAAGAGWPAQASIPRGSCCRTAAGGCGGNGSGNC